VHDSSLLKLHFVQISKAWEKSRHNVYSDSLKKDYHNKLESLFQKLKSENFNDLNSDQIKERIEVLNFFSNSITFLDNSTSNNLPFELTACLEEALSDWSDNKEYIIVTTLVKGLHEFSFNPNLAFNDDQYVIIESLFDIHFNQRLVQINVPEYLVQDYLSNVVQYHELGHFIDEKYHIQEVLWSEFQSDFADKKIKSDFYTFFPFMKHFKNDFSNEEAKRLLKNHIGEYFCDLFASQYVSNSLSSYLSYLSDLTGLSETHPPTALRVQFVEDFLNNRKGYTISTFLRCAEYLTSKKIKIRYKKFDSNDFLNLLPVDIQSKNHLHYLFVYGWKLWTREYVHLENRNKIGYRLSPNEVHEIVNNLIEKSIGNYVINKKWEHLKNVSFKKTNTKDPQ
jgi:hypothetical protein